MLFLEVRALKNVFFGGPRAENSIDSLDSIDSIESTDSIDIIDSIDSILVPHKETANIHTTHKGANKSTDGGLAPIGTFVRARSARAPLCVV